MHVIELSFVYIVGDNEKVYFLAGVVSMRCFAGERKSLRNPYNSKPVICLICEPVIVFVLYVINYNV